MKSTIEKIQSDNRWKRNGIKTNIWRHMRHVQAIVCIIEMFFKGYVESSCHLIRHYSRSQESIVCIIEMFFKDNIESSCHLIRHYLRSQETMPGPKIF